MAQVEFKWHVHDGKMYESREWFEHQVGFTLTEEQWEQLGSPFYEVELDCVLDTDTMKVELVGAKL